MEAPCGLASKTVSGTFLGRNSYLEFIATAQYHDKWEWFCAREHPHGGPILLVTYGSHRLPMRKGGEDNKEFILDEQEKQGTRWDFFRIG